MKGDFCFEICNVETKVDNVPIKIGRIMISGSAERSWWDMFMIHQFVKSLPKWMSRLYTEVSKMEGITR